MSEELKKSQPNERPRPRGSEAVPLEKIDEVHRSELAMAAEQIHMIGESLKDLAHRIERDRPDVVVFLDLSARVFGTPFLKHLHDVMHDHAPKVRFYNDQELKHRYLYCLPTEDVVQHDMGPLRGKKVFFIDETFSAGKGAVAIEEAASSVGIDAHYFALSRSARSDFGVKDGKPELAEDVHNAKLDALKKSGRIIVYDNPIDNMFSRFATRLYVQDWQGETLPLDQDPTESEQGSSLPNANDYIIPPDGMTTEEYVAAVSSRADSFVSSVKDMIYKALKGE